MDADPGGVVWVPGSPEDPVRAEPLTRVGVGPADLDTDADGVADTVVVAAGRDLLLHTDLDGDGLADQVLRIGPGSFDTAMFDTGPFDTGPLAEPGEPGCPTDPGAPGDEVLWWAPWTWFRPG